MTAFWPKLLTSMLIVLTVVGLAAGEEVRWRYEYGPARTEAQKAGLPLLLDFSTDWCTYCKKLDVTTFKDPQVVRTLNEKFVPVKLDGNREKRLVDALRLQGYPTIILAAPDGKILKNIEGYVDAAKLQVQLEEVSKSLTNPEWMTKAAQEATRAVAAGDFVKAVVLIKSVLEDEGQRPLQNQARRQLQEIEQQAQVQYSKARQRAERGEYLEALVVLESLQERYAGTQASTEAGKLLVSLSEKPEVKTQQRSRRATEILAMARADFRDQQYLCCVDRCAVLATNYGDLPEAAEALKVLEQIKANPEWMKAACETLADRLCEMYIALAETWVKKGESGLAEECLQRAVTLKGSRHLEAAKVRLAQIQGQPARSVEKQ
jgi:thioredoxin-related protein